MSFREEVERKITYIVCLVLFFASIISDTVRNGLRENAVFVIPFVVLAAVVEVKKHIDDLQNWMYDRTEGKEGKL